MTYVANSATGEVHVNKLYTGNSTLKLLDKIQIQHSIDNLSVDSNGDIFVASFPQLHKYLKSTKSPMDIFPPVAAWRIRRRDDGTHNVDKILEDNGSILPSSTIAVHDPQTGRMFLGGEFIPDIKNV
jgi:arylesterase/paraoxonase